MAKLEDAQEQAQRYNLHIQDDSISLIIDKSGSEDEGVENHNALFVKWHRVAEGSARPVRLDRQMRIIYNVPYMKPLKTYNIVNITFIVKRLPVFMFKSKASGRMTMPPWALLLQAWEQAKIFPGPLEHLFAQDDLERFLRRALKVCSVVLFVPMSNGT